MRVCIACRISDWGEGGITLWKKKELSEGSCVINVFGSYIEINMYKVTVISLMQCKKVLMKCDLFHEMKEHSHDFKTVVMLQNCMGLIKDEPDSDSETYETNLEDGTEGGNITDEDADIKIEESDIKIEDSDIKIEESDIKIEESDIKIEEAEDIKEENPEVITIPPIKPEPEVSVWGLCIRQQCFLLPRQFTATKREIMKIHFNYPYVCTVHFVQFIIQTNHCPTCILTINFCIVTLQVL